MRVYIETLELRIQELEEENMQLKGELDERPTCEDKQMDEQYIDELQDQVKRLRIQRDKLHLALSRTLQDLSDARTCVQPKRSCSRICALKPNINEVKA